MLQPTTKHNKEVPPAPPRSHGGLSNQPSTTFHKEVPPAPPRSYGGLSNQPSTTCHKEVPPAPPRSYGGHPKEPMLLTNNTPIGVLIVYYHTNSTGKQHTNRCTSSLLLHQSVCQYVYF